MTFYEDWRNICTNLKARVLPTLTPAIDRYAQTKDRSFRSRHAESCTTVTKSLPSLLFAEKTTCRVVTSQAESCKPIGATRAQNFQPRQTPEKNREHRRARYCTKRRALLFCRFKSPAPLKQTGTLGFKSIGVELAIASLTSRRVARPVETHGNPAANFPRMTSFVLRSVSGLKIEIRPQSPPASWGQAVDDLRTFPDSAALTIGIKPRPANFAGTSRRCSEDAFERKRIILRSPAAFLFYALNHKPERRERLTITDEKLAYTVTTLAKASDRSVRWIKQKIYEGEIRAIKRGGIWAIPADAAREYFGVKEKSAEQAVVSQATA